MSRGTAFGAWLRQRRKEAGLTSKELAQGVGCSIATIEKMEGGIRRPSRQIAELIADYFGIANDERQAFVQFARSDDSGEQMRNLDEAASRAPWRILYSLRALNTLRSRPNNLPAQRTALVGREQEVAALVAGLRRPDVRLFTVTGPPGIGKTRLALQAATDLLEEFQDGAFFVPLSAVSDAESVAPMIALTLRVPQQAGNSTRDNLVEYLRHKQMLLVLDNYEQVLGAAALVSELLNVAAGLKVIVTSREAFRLYGEHELELPTLSVPGPTQHPTADSLMRYASVRLYVERAQAARYDFNLTDANAAAVASICRRLDGVPLAIELAAAHVRTLSPEEIDARLARRFDLLSGGPLDLPARHQAVRSAISWSYDLLGVAEKRLFRQLSVFVGGWTLEAAQWVAVAGDRKIRNSTPQIRHTLDSLVAKSLVQQTHSPEGVSRYWLLATIREFAREQLEISGEAGELQQRHKSYCVQMSEEAEPMLRGAQQAAWLDTIEAEYGNVQAALECCLQAGDATSGLRIAGALWRFWMVRGYLTDGRRQIGAMLDLPYDGEATELYSRARAKALNAVGVLAGIQGDYSAARAFFEEAVALFRQLGDTPTVAGILSNLGNIAKSLGEYGRARALQEESLAIRRELGDRQGIANSLANLGNVAHAQGDYVSARKLYEESMVVQREMGDNWSIANSLNNLGVVAQEQNDLEAARLFFQQSLDMRRELGDKRGIARSLHNLGTVAKDIKSYNEAITLTGESLAIYHELEDKPGIALCLESLAVLLSLQGKWQRAVLLWGAAEVLRETLGTPMPAANQALHDMRVIAARERLGDVVFNMTWRKGRATPLEEAIALAQESH